LPHGGNIQVPPNPRNQDRFNDGKARRSNPQRPYFLQPKE
jgi:hypothetical protein